MNDIFHILITHCRNTQKYNYYHVNTCICICTKKYPVYTRQNSEIYAIGQFSVGSREFSTREFKNFKILKSASLNLEFFLGCKFEFRHIMGELSHKSSRARNSI